MTKAKIYASIDSARKRIGYSSMTRGSDFLITMRHNGREESFHFHDNVNECSGLVDWLQCLILDMNAYDFTQNTNAFMQEYGYEDMKEAKKVRYQCYLTSKKLHRLFSDEELDILSEIE